MSTSKMSVRKGMEIINYAEVFGFWSVIEINKKAGRKFCYICEGSGEDGKIKKEVCNFGVFCNNPECRAKRCHIPGHGACIACGHMACRFGSKCRIVSNSEKKAEHLEHYCHHSLEDRIRWYKLWILSVINNPETNYRIKHMTEEEIKDIKQFENEEKKRKAKIMKMKEKKERKEKKRLMKMSEMTRDEEGNIIFKPYKFNIEIKEKSEDETETTESENYYESEEYYQEFPQL